MPHDRILSKLDNTIWLITNDALDGLYRAVEGGLDDTDRSIFHAAEPGAVSMLKGSDSTKSSFIDGNTGFIYIDGPIIPYANNITNVSGVTSIDILTRDFEAFIDNDAVNHIVFIIDSPGGAVTGVSEFANLVANSSKKTTSFVVGNAASAAYWIAAASDWIVSVDTGTSGSIGVVSRRILNKNKNVVEIQSTQSPNKRPDMETKEGRAVVQEHIDDIADVMIGFIASKRGVSKDYVTKNFGRGAVMIASKAKEVGMIDSVMTLDNFIGNMDNVMKGTHDTKLVLCDTNIQTNPANAGKGRQQMKLRDYLAENPAANAEVEELQQQAFNAGAKSVMDKTEKLSPYLDPNSVYPKAIQNFALEALRGDISIDAVRAAATMIDSMNEMDNSKNAQEESTDIPEIPVVAEKQSTKGEMNTLSDTIAAMNELRIIEGKEPING